MTAAPERKRKGSEWPLVLGVAVWQFCFSQHKKGFHVRVSSNWQHLVWLVSKANKGAKAFFFEPRGGSLCRNQLGQSMP